MEMNTPTPPGDRKFLLFDCTCDYIKIMQTLRIFLVLLIAVGSHSWTEAHDMNKALNRTCALEVLPDYPQYTNGNSSGVAGLSYPAGGLVSGRPFFCGGKIDHDWTNWPFLIRPECYTLKNNNWVFVANMTTARYKHGGVSLGDSLWVTGKTKLK